MFIRSKLKLALAAAIVLATLLIICRSPTKSFAAGLQNRVIDIRAWSHPGFDRVVIDLSEKPVFDSASSDDHKRLVIDIFNCSKPMPIKPISFKGSSVSAIRESQLNASTTRVTIDLKRNSIAHIFNLPPNSKHPHHRMVIDVKQKPPAQQKKAASPKGSATTQASVNQDGNTVLNAQAGQDHAPAAVRRKQPVSPLPAYAGTSTPSLTGQIRNETAFRISGPFDLTKEKTILTLKTTGNISDNVSYTLIGRAYYDAVFDLTDNYPKTVANDMKWEADLREAYIDASLGNFDLRLGRQQIVWGQAVGLFVADVVNPKDYREFILPDLSDIRIPSWATNIDYYNFNTYFQFVWIPILEFNKFGRPGSEFYYANPVPPGIQVRMLGTNQPSNTIENSIAGFRVNKLINDWDLSAFYLHGYDYTPVQFSSLSTNTLTSIPELTISPSYERMDIYGATFSKNVGNVILNGEFVYNKGQYFPISTLINTDGVAQKNSFEGLIGASYTFFGKVDTNFQILENAILNYDKAIIQRERNTYWSAWLKTGFFDNRVEPEVFYVSSFDIHDTMFRPKITFKLTDASNLALGADIFSGESTGQFGRYDNRDRVYLNISYDF